MGWSTHEWVYGEGGVLIAKIKSMGGNTASLDLRHILDVIFAIQHKMSFDEILYICFWDRVNIKTVKLKLSAKNTF